MLVVVGGSKHYNKVSGKRDCLNDVLIYNPPSSQWTELQCSGAMFEQRRHHVACVVGLHLIVHGGISIFGNYLRGLMGLMLGKATQGDWKQKNYKWFEVKIQGVKPKKLAYHTMQLVLQYERYRGLFPIDLFSLPEIRALSSRVLIH